MILEAQARRQFLQEYRCVRHAEGRGSEDPAYYAALPYEDLTGRNSAMWEMRAKTYRYFERRILVHLENKVKRPLKILDLGAGNGWLSYRLSLRNHHVIALDIFTDPLDGLGACRRYPIPVQAVESDFHLLPFREQTFDLAIYNSSLHYSIDCVATLSEARKCLVKSGVVIVLDSPVYRKHEHGEQMVTERQNIFQERYGFPSNALESIEFLDESTLELLSRSSNLHWKIYRPWYGLQWHLRPWKALLRNRRPPSRFWILMGAFGES